MVCASWANGFRPKLSEAEVEHTFTLREVAHAIAAVDGLDGIAARHIHQQIRGWAQRALLSTAERDSEGHTAARRYTVEDACRIRLLLVFRDFFGVEGDELRRLEAQIRAEDRDVQPDNTPIYTGLRPAVEGIAKRHKWTLAVTLMRDPFQGGERTIRGRLVRDEQVQDPTGPDYQLPPGYVLYGFMRVPATELLAPLIGRLAELGNTEGKNLTFAVQLPQPQIGAAEPVKVN